MQTTLIKKITLIFICFLLAGCGADSTLTSPPPDLETATEPPVSLSTSTPTETMPPADWFWERLPGDTPSARGAMAAVFDEGRGVIVLFGGRASENVPFSETWEFNGISWNQVKTSHTPPARIWHAMAYDSTRQVVVLFGGNASTGTPVYLNDTWEYDGRDWTQVDTPASPFPRGSGALVYDSCRRVTVLFGGENADGNAPSTWEYDGQTWTEKRVAVSPPGRGLAAMVFDPARCRTVLFGGGSGPNGLNDTWEYDGAAWLQVQTVHTPEGRWAHAMAYYPSVGGVVLFGGYLPGSSTDANDTWLYDGIDWLQLQSEDAPVAQEQHILVSGFRGGNLLLLGNDEMWIFLHRQAVAALTLTPVATITPLVTPAPTPHCATGWSRLVWGGDAIVTAGDLPNRVRSSPDTDPDNIIATLYPAEIVHIGGGPWCNDGLVFWKVESESIPGGVGWTAEGDGVEYWLEPYNP